MPTNLSLWKVYCGLSSWIRNFMQCSSFSDTPTWILSVLLNVFVSNRKLALVGIIPNQILSLFFNQGTRIVGRFVLVDSGNPGHLVVERELTASWKARIRTQFLSWLWSSVVRASDSLSEDPFESRQGCAVFFRLIQLTILLSLSETVRLCLYLYMHPNLLGYIVGSSSDSLWGIGGYKPNRLQTRRRNMKERARVWERERERERESVCVHCMPVEQSIRYNEAMFCSAMGQ